MNKLNYLFSFCVINFTCVALSGQPSCVDSEQQTLKQNHEKFIHEIDQSQPTFVAALKKFKKAVVANDFKYLYSIRPPRFKKIVSIDNFLKNFCKNIYFPSEVYFSIKDSRFQEHRIQLKSFYLQDEIAGHSYIVKSTDQWEFDVKGQKWYFVSNELVWGSSVIVDK